MVIAERRHGTLVRGFAMVGRQHELRFAAILAVASIHCVQAPAQAADPRAGRAFAVENCSRCHAIGADGASPNRRAPTFRSIGGRYKLEDLEEAFAEGIVTGHSGMPEFTLTPRQIDDLLAHLRRVRARR